MAKGRFKMLPNNFHIWSKNQHKRNSDNYDSNHINKHLNHKSIPTGEFKDWRYVTEKVIQLVLATEREREDLVGKPYMH